VEIHVSPLADAIVMFENGIEDLVEKACEPLLVAWEALAGGGRRLSVEQHPHRQRPRAVL